MGVGKVSKGKRKTDSKARSRMRAAEHERHRMRGQELETVTKVISSL